jgi:formylglycine-generating enzyme
MKSYFLPAAVLAAATLWSPPGAAADARAAGSVFRDCPDCPEMVVVPAGAFVMGTPAVGTLLGTPLLAGAEPAPAAGRLPRSLRAESTPVGIRVARPYALGRHEVTRAEYARFVAETDYEPKAGCRLLDDAAGRYVDDRARGWLNPPRPAVPRDDHPVTCVSFADATAYAQWLARKTGKPYRLPGEAEWEYAARAGAATLRPWGDEPALGCSEANGYDLGAADLLRLGTAAAACRDGYTDLAPVGSLRANAFGLGDLLGNVAEWTQDCATDSYVGRPEDTRPWVWVGGCTRRIVRGGGWNSPPALVRSAARVEQEATDRHDALGFRVALDLDGKGDAR